MKPTKAEKPDAFLAVSARLEAIDDRKFRVTMDDVVGDDPSMKRLRRICLYTYFDLDRESALRAELTEKQCARIGELLMARLLALSASDEFPPDSTDDGPTPPPGDS